MAFLFGSSFCNFSRWYFLFSFFFGHILSLYKTYEFVFLICIFDWHFPFVVVHNNIFDAQKNPILFVIFLDCFFLFLFFNKYTKQKKNDNIQFTTIFISSNSFALHLSVALWMLFKRILLHNFNVGLNFIAITLRLFVFCSSCTSWYCIVSKVLPVVDAYFSLCCLFAVFLLLSLLLLLDSPIQTMQIEHTIKCASLIALFCVFFSLNVECVCVCAVAWNRRKLKFHLTTI